MSFIQCRWIVLRYVMFVLFLCTLFDIDADLRCSSFVHLYISIVIHTNLNTSCLSAVSVRWSMILLSCFFIRVCLP
ncbi:hypothetical protein BDZ88DRAFT_414117 [Geranomyces variabilis]|nr:hypothetical protein BDZ88DRAFT_414117 [Geranomyces variabilis]